MGAGEGEPLLCLCHDLTSIGLVHRPPFIQPPFVFLWTPPLLPFGFFDASPVNERETPLALRGLSHFLESTVVHIERALRSHHQPGHHWRGYLESLEDRLRLCWRAKLATSIHHLGKWTSGRSQQVQAVF